MTVNRAALYLFPGTQFIALIAFAPHSAYATIDLGATTVTSVGHRFDLPDPAHPFHLPRFVVDYLVEQSQSFDGGATTLPVTTDLDTDTSISYTVAAPVGYKFQIQIPPGVAAFMSPQLGWRRPANDSGSSIGFSASFADLIGTPPNFDNNSAVGDGNQFFSVAGSSSQLPGNLLFSSVTFTVSYSPRSNGLGPLIYQPDDSASFGVSYQTTSAVDPGPFVWLAHTGPAFADYNHNGFVDAADYTVWRDERDESGLGLAADGNGDGIVNLQDYVLWRDNFPAPPGSASGNEISVPEPSTAALLVIGCVSCLTIAGPKPGRAHLSHCIVA